MQPGRRYRLGQPPIWISEVTLRCPDGVRVVRVPGPTSAEAIRKGVALPPGRCVKQSVRLIKTGRGAGLDGVLPNHVPGYYERERERRRRGLHGRRR